MQLLALTLSMQYFQDICPERQENFNNETLRKFPLRVQMFLFYDFYARNMFFL